MEEKFSSIKHVCFLKQVYKKNKQAYITKHTASFQPSGVVKVSEPADYP